MIPTEKTIISNAHITEVDEFFFSITEKYQHFEFDILRIIDNIPVYSPEQIFLECENIGLQRNELAVMDQQLFRIIELAGSELAETTLIHDYRVAVAGATMACNNLFQKLSAVKTALQKDALPPFSPNNR